MARDTSGLPPGAENPTPRRATARFPRGRGTIAKIGFRLRVLAAQWYAGRELGRWVRARVKAQGWDRAEVTFTAPRKGVTQARFDRATGEAFERLRK